MSPRIIPDGIVPQATLSRALLRRLSVPAVDHGFDVVSDPPPARRIPEAKEQTEAGDETQPT